MDVSGREIEASAASLQSEVQATADEPNRLNPSHHRTKSYFEREP
jgi:hypothetical protein